MNSLSVTREHEEQYFKSTLKIVDEKLKTTSAEVVQMKKDIDSMWDQYFAGDTEIWVPLHNTMAMLEQQSKVESKLSRAGKKPYFGRIIFTDSESGTKESLYIGRFGVNSDLTTQVVADWRAPISNVYYENGLGKCTFLSPDGDDIELELELKRTFDIEDGRLDGYVDSDVVANDELLTKYLSRNKQAVLSEIVATIQKEQNDIIRRTAFKNVIVQGAAGSGKTTVAMHRISYILYNYADRITPDRFYIIGSNKMLLNYITGVLPELDVEGVKQMTMEELFASVLGDKWDEEKHKIAHNVHGDGSTERFEKLVEFCGRLESRKIPVRDIVLNRDCYTEGIENGKTGIYDRSVKNGTDDYLEYENGAQKYKRYGSCVRIVPKEYIARLLDENPEMSIQRKIDLLNEKLLDNLEFEFTSHASRYTVKEMNAIRKAFAGLFGKPEYEADIFDVFEDFLKESHDTQVIKALAASREYDVYDLAALAYLYKRIYEKEELRVDYHIVIDEAQDYGMLAYRVLKRCFYNCTYTVMGDISQNIRYDTGINNWDELRELLLSSEGDAFCTLRKSYRNTVEISNFATKILDHGNFDVYPVEPIIRHGDEPCVLQVGVDEVIPTIREMCRTWQDDGHGTIAVVCRTEEEAGDLSKRLAASGVELLGSEPESTEFGNGIMVLPVSLTKGLEFDAVLLYEPTRQSYPTDDRHAKLLYVAATRALHELCVVCSGNLTGLIADEVPADKLRRVVDADPVAETMSPGEKMRMERKSKSESDEYVKAQILSKTVEKGVGERAASLVGGHVTTAGTVTDRKNTREDAFEDEATDEIVSAKTENIKGAFASEAKEELLTMKGHASPALGAKWITKQNNGIYVQSRYGILRILPISAGVIRMTFVRGSSFGNPNSGLVKDFSMLKNVIQRENPRTLEISTGAINLSLEKSTGSIIYKDAKGRELLRERNPESRVVMGDGDSALGYMNFMPKKSASWHAYNTADKNLKYIGDKALYITPDKGGPALVMVKDSFALMPVSKGRTVFNNLAGQGTSVISEGESIDFFFMVADNTDDMIRYYHKLCGAEV